MFFVISKILSFLITPTVWIGVLLLAALLVKRQPLKKRLFIWACVAFYFFSNDFIVNEFMRPWEIPAIQDSAIKGKYDVGIVLGGMIEYDPSYKRPQFEHGTDRLLQALRLYKEGKIRYLVIDGGIGSLTEQYDEAPILRKYLLQVGIPDTSIVIEPRSRNTHENAVFVKPLLDSVAPHGRYILFTSGYHMRRALGCFRKAGIKVLPYSTDRFAGPLKFQLDYMLVPDAHAFDVWDAMLHEWMGCIVYKASGYM